MLKAQPQAELLHFEVREKLEFHFVYEAQNF